MAFESSDLSDGMILDKTQQFQNGNGQVQFKITLPSGRQLESEWIKEDMKKKAMVAWLDVVKAEAVADADAVRTEAREKAQNAAPKAPAPTQETVSTSTSYSAPTAGSQAAKAASTSPDSFVEQGLALAQADYQHWNQVAMEAATRMQEAYGNITKWANIKEALRAGGASKGNGSQASSGKGDSSGTVGGDNSIRRRRRRKPEQAERIGDADISSDNVRAGSSGV